MAAFNAGTYRASADRTAPGLRFSVYAALSVAIMVFDRHGGWMARVRYYLDAAAYPVQVAVSSPVAGWRWLQDNLVTRETLQKQNAQLTARDRELSLQVMRLQALESENAELRGLKAALPPLAERWLAAEVVDVEINGLRQRLMLNRGARNGVFRGQAVLDSSGLLGQTVRISPWSSEVILITDPEHAVPVEIARTGVRTIAVGTGDPTSVALPYLPANADVKAGDLLITSGLGGVFPRGYPVARINEVRHDAVQSLAQIRATTVARPDVVHEVMLVWFREGHPDGPDHGPDTVGNPDLQSQHAPPLEPLPPVTLPRLKPEPVPPAGGPDTASRPGARLRTGAPGQASAPADSDDDDSDGDDH